MELSALTGNARLKEQLSMRRNGLPHACILSGPEGSGKHTLSRLLVAAMLCTGAEMEGRPCGVCPACRKVKNGTHPDVITVGPVGGKAVTVEQVRQARASAFIQPNEGERKVYLFEQADELSLACQNALLKVLEDGPPYAAFLLLAENAGALLQTVRSRCEELPLTPVSLPESEEWLTRRYPGKTPEEIRQAALDCQGILGRAVQELEGQDENVVARAALVKRIADAMEKGTELQLLEAALGLDNKLGRTELARTLEELEQELVRRMVRAGDRRRGMRAVSLLRRIREALPYNIQAGVVAGWLCAGMFSEET